MSDLSAAFATAFRLIVGLDEDLVEIVVLSLEVSLLAVALASAIGLPGGGAIALFRFPGRRFVVAAMHAMMGLPPVVAGLFVYLMLSRAGPLGELGLLFTPAAMVIVQCLLVVPIISALTYQTVAELHEEYDELLRSFGRGPARTLATLLWDGRFRLLTGVLAGFGRAAAEVGAVIIVGGNINHVTRMMTTSIALETSKGNLALALGLGILLLTLTLLVNGLALAVRDAAWRRHG